MHGATVVARLLCFVLCSSISELTFDDLLQKRKYDYFKVNSDKFGYFRFVFHRSQH